MTPATIRTLVTPIDGSELSERALPLAEELASRLEASMLLLSVPRPSGASLAAISEPEANLASATPDVSADARDRALSYLAQRAGALRRSRPGVPIDTLVHDDHEPARAIALTADSVPDGMIVMGFHGRRGLSRWLFGSVAETVLTETRRPLLLVPAESAYVPKRIARILVGLDGSEEAEAVLPYVSAIARANLSRVLLVHVEPHFRSLSRWRRDQEDKNAATSYRAWIGDKLNGTARAMQAQGVMAQAVTVPDGDVAEILIAEADRDAIDLIALTTHGGGESTKWIMGDVCTRVARHAGCPVLLLPNK
ncbi:MAG: universal stress protein [Acidobacteria bacterium]|nr:universal stress protein [Acidobacteriota bacterium]